MILAAAALAFLLLYIDKHLIGARVGWLYAGGANGAKTLLSTVAASVITVAGVVFSITISALTQASSQFGPRLLRNFLRDTTNQIVLGTFVATFMYCLLVLRTIHGKMEDGVEFVPQASVTVAVLLAAASMAVLILFIHHVSVSLQAPAVVAAVLADLEQVVARLPDGPEGGAVPRSGCDGLPADFETDARPVASTKQGYIQAVDYDGLIAAAADAGVVLDMAYRPGDYVIAGSTLLRTWPGARWKGDEAGRRVNAAFICGRHPTGEQDVERAIRQMVEVAVRALSPGINDPFTAINCIDALGSAICRVARKGLPGPHKYDRKGTLRIVTPATSFAGVVDTAFNQIRQYGRGSVAVTIRLLEVIAAIGELTTGGEQRQALMRQAEMIYRDSRDAIPQQQDLDDVRRRWEAVARTLGRRDEPAGMSTMQ
jgi:uncharacterized membrane protein